MESCFLYKIENKVNGKCYIGITKRPKTRMYEHFYGRRTTHVSLIKQAILKYGPENFEFTVLCEGSRDYIVDLEMKAIAAYNTIVSGYNIRAGGEDCDTGHKIAKRSDDKPLYAKGFWFPNTRTCQDKLGISDCNLYKWKKAGTLGEVQRLRKDSIEVPTYVGGFWFDTLTRASHCLNQNKSTLKKRVKDGFIEEQQRPKGVRGEENHMFGKTGEKHHNSKKVLVDFVVYGSIAEAVRESEFTKKMIYNRLKNNTPGFSVIDNKE